MSMCLICDNEDAYYRYMGEDCERTIQRQLRELETYAAVLHAFAFPTRSGPATGGRAPGYASRSPANDAAIVALDPRSKANGNGPDDTDEPILSIPAGVHELATWMREEHQLQHPRQWSTTTEIAYLLGQVAYAAMHRWCTEFAKQIAELHHQARGLARDQPPRPIGDCREAECGGYIYPATLRASDGTTFDGTRCPRCLRVYTGLDLVKLYQAQRIDAAMLSSWLTAKDTEPVTTEPTDGRPIRSELNVWRRGPDGLWRSARTPNGHGVPFTALVKTLDLRYITEEEARACTTS